MKQGQKQGKQGRKSQKGTRGNVVGAPPKPVHWPNGKFSMEGLTGMNSNQCKLSLCNKLKSALINPSKGTGNPDGTVYQLQSRKQPNGKVGRPEHIFVTKGNYDSTKMVLFQDAPVEEVSTAPATKTPRVKKNKTPDVAVVTTPPSSTTPVVEADATATVPVADVAPSFVEGTNSPVVAATAPSVVEATTVVAA